MTAWYIIGSLTAVWAVLVAIVGITKEDFPGGAEKIVGAISVLLVISAISAAVISAANESEEHSGGAEATSESP
jgi:hypothetical protein